MWAILGYASDEATDASQSFANLRHRSNRPKVRSTTHRRGKTSKPLTISRAQFDVPAAASLQCVAQFRSGITLICEGMQTLRASF